MLLKLNPTKTIIEGKKIHNNSKNVLQFYDDECRELEKYSNEQLEELLQESKIIAEGQQFDNEISSRGAIYSAMALVTTIVFSVIDTKFAKIQSAVLLILVIVLVAIGLFFIQRSVNYSYLREYHNFRTMCINDILDVRKKNSQE